MGYHDLCGYLDFSSHKVEFRLSWKNRDFVHAVPP
jgi:hypothetical protein